jgi:hypothetical protein
VIGNLISSAYCIIPFAFRSEVSLTNKAKITKQPASSNGFVSQWHYTALLPTALLLALKIKNCVIPGFCREVDENCALLGYYAAYGGKSDVSGQPIRPVLRVSLPKFRDNPSVLF